MHAGQQITSGKGERRLAVSDAQRQLTCSFAFLHTLLESTTSTYQCTVTKPLPLVTLLHQPDPCKPIQPSNRRIKNELICFVSLFSVSFAHRQLHLLGLCPVVQLRQSECRTIDSAK